MLRQLGLHLLLTHSVPAWTLVVMAALFLGLETARLLLGHRSSDAHDRWLDHAAAQHETIGQAQASLTSALEILGQVVERIGGPKGGH